LQEISPVIKDGRVYIDLSKANKPVAVVELSIKKAPENIQQTEFLVEFKECAEGK